MVKDENILILAKTYPSPSSKHVETSCVAGITEAGEMRRLFPVPFRLLNGDTQFKKWQWISTKLIKAPADHRAESHRLYVDTVEIIGEEKSRNGWEKRWRWIDSIPAFDDFDALQEAQQRTRISLALLKPRKITGLDIVAEKNPEWTEEEKEKLLQSNKQLSLFSQGEIQRTPPDRMLRKLPYSFYYEYECHGISGWKSYRHKIIDWEAGSLYMNCERSHGPKWEIPFRAKLQNDLPTKDLMFLMGNFHRFQNQWAIISLIYPPKRQQHAAVQQDLF